jgi:hypothetical protein
MSMSKATQTLGVKKNCIHLHAGLTPKVSHLGSQNCQKLSLC